MLPPVAAASCAWVMGISESPKSTVACWMSVIPTLEPAGE